MITLAKEVKYTDYHKIKLDFTSAIFDNDFPCTIYVECGYNVAKFRYSADLQKLVNFVMQEFIDIDDNNTLVMNSTKMEVWTYRNDQH